MTATANRCSELLRASRWLLPALPPPFRSQRAALRNRWGR
jgi:hypothetical protein